MSFERAIFVPSLLDMDGSCPWLARHRIAAIGRVWSAGTSSGIHISSVGRLDAGRRRWTQVDVVEPASEIFASQGWALPLVPGQA